MENNKALIQGSSSMKNVRQNDDELENEDSDYIASDEEDDDDDDSYIDDNEEDECVDLNIVFPPETFCLVNTNVGSMTTNTPTTAADFQDEIHEDSDVLHTLPESEDEELAKEAIRDYAMETMKSLYLKKNENEFMVVKCDHSGCPFHVRISKRIGNPFWKIAYMAMLRAIEIIQGAGRDQFLYLRSYADELKESNRNSTVIIQCDMANVGPVFQRIYGEHGGQLMAAVGQDGNNQIFPIAYVVVEAETKESWQWFLNLLLEDLNNVQPNQYAFISDQQKGLVPAIQNLGNHVEQRLCVKHLYGNWSKKYPGLELKQVFWMAPRVTTVPTWERAMNRLKVMNEKAWKDMMDVPPAMWTRSHFKLDTQSDLQVNNMCEAFNRAMLEYRDKPIITLLEGIKHYLTKRIGTKKDLMQTYRGNICPIIQEKLEKTKRAADGWQPTWHHDDDFAIFGVTNGTETYIVNLKQKTCICRKWGLTGISCCHAIACIWQHKFNLNSHH
ncbi:hypothetical protein TSUD_374590 [Trifolium subterraneum]|uniref:SWIM-type domain-containing protein n=1 Tax=Trifolium subterraneum TaxID=3900 RepID=A0A2Z6PGK7_TRISU|nr:hypothetical protein TSUD_374590 [Trifolium subterraneum]